MVSLGSTCSSSVRVERQLSHRERDGVTGPASAATRRASWYSFPYQNVSFTRASHASQKMNSKESSLPYRRSAGEPPDRRDERTRIGTALPGDVERAAVRDRGE